MTRLPVPSRWQGSELKTFARVPYGFLFVGLMMGGLTGGLACGLLQVLPVWLTAMVAFGCSVVFTGAMHEDGVADVADGMGAWSRERRFEIMRDSRIGAYGVMALIVTSAFRVGCIGYLLKTPLWAFFVLLVCGGLSRWSALALMSLLPYLRNRPGGVGIADGMTQPNRIWMMVQICLLAIALMSLDLMVGVSMVAMTLVSVGVLYVFFRKWLGGITGDCLGAGIVMTECVLLAWGVILMTSIL